MSQVFAFRSGRSIRNVQAQAVGAELERIRQARGQLQPADVLEEAANPDSPLHAAFEWDDNQAAAEYRLQQARKLIVSIRILNGPTRTEAPVYCSVRTPEKGREYRPVAEVLSDEALKARALDDIRATIESYERKFRQFEDLAELLQRMKKMVG